MDNNNSRLILLELEKWLDDGIAIRSKAHDNYGQIEGQAFELVKRQLEHLKMKYA